MSLVFIKVVKDNLLNTQITVDKLHILKLINEAVNKVHCVEDSSNQVLTGLEYIF